jgi:hypothetical protein
MCCGKHMAMRTQQPLSSSEAAAVRFYQLRSSISTAMREPTLMREPAPQLMFHNVRSRSLGTTIDAERRGNHVTLAFDVLVSSSAATIAAAVTAAGCALFERAAHPPYRTLSGMPRAS